MNATVLWIAILAIAVITEICGRRFPDRVATLERTLSLVASRVLGRVILVVCWIFVGVHLFARYSVPHSG